MQIIKLRQ